MEEKRKSTTKENKTNSDDKKFSQADVNEMIKKALADFVKTQAVSQPSVIQVTKNDDMVTLMFTDTIAQGSIVSLGKLGQINSSFGTIDVPKKEFMQNKDAKVDKLLAKRKLVVLNGLTAEETERYGLVYKDGELLDQTAYYKLLDFSAEEIVNLFEKLCLTHKKVVATTFITAYENGDKRVTQEKVKLLNDISKEYDEDGMLTPILKDMGKRLSK